MSDAIGAIKFGDEIWYYQYNGTSSLPISHIYPTMSEVYENWRNHEWKTCECGGEEKVEVYTDYGAASYFGGFACRNCKSIRMEPLKSGDVILDYRDYPKKQVFEKPDWYDEIEWEVE